MNGKGAVHVRADSLDQFNQPTAVSHYGYWIGKSFVRLFSSCAGRKVAVREKDAILVDSRHWGASGAAGFRGARSLKMEEFQGGLSRAVKVAKLLY